MSAKLLAFALCLVLISACGSTSTVPRQYPVPEDANNPIVIQYFGATATEMVSVVTQMCADVPIQTVQVVPREGYIETAWVDLGSFAVAGALADAYPPEERWAVFAFQVNATGDNEGVLQISGWYQPSRSPGRARVRDARWDRYIPIDHPGYQLMLSFDWRLRNQHFPGREIEVLGMGPEVSRSAGPKAGLAERQPSVLCVTTFLPRCLDAYSARSALATKLS
jgi:hypothetical protein